MTVGIPASAAIRAGSRRGVLRKPGFIGLLVTNFVLGLTSAFIVPFGSIWATKEIGMSSSGVGSFMTINSLSAIVISMIIARWSDTHVSRRRLLVIGGSAGALGNLAFAYVRDPIVLTLIGSSVLAVASINFAQLFAHVREELGREEHAGTDVPFVMGVLRACFALAWMLGPLLGAQIVSHFGYRGIFLTASASFLVFIVLVLTFVAHRPHAPQAQVAANTATPLRGEREPVLWGLGQPRVLAHALAFALMFAAFTINSLNLPLFLTQKLGATEQGVGIAFSISPLFEMGFMLLFGHLAAKGHQLTIIALGIGAAVFYFVALRFVTAPSDVYPMQILNAAAVAVTTSVAIPFFQDLMPGKAGLATSLYSSALKVGSLVGFAAFGLLASRVGNAGLFLVCAALGATTLTIVLFARPGTRSSSSAA